MDVSKGEAWRKELVNELAALDAQRERIARAISDLDLVLGVRAREVSAAPDRSDTTETRYDRILKVLHAATKPLDMKAIADGLEALGDPKARDRNTVDSSLRGGMKKGLWGKPSKGFWEIAGSRNGSVH